ncbi:MAG: bifunctional phosphopantothenoylcysteine decarboxylase/phosphopantothenate--cysteine ligase CoaBC [Ignavibacteria bacterium]|nr:bifunctional phosphopantothenoylcysteine decarboxylase/phosphopantothenate--cysteine ligase CoaBC [Ignavibacteria bacterium]
MLKGKHILVGVTGGIAAYKVCYLVRELKKAGADVRVVMTEAGARFVTPLTFSALSEHETLVDLWADDQATGSSIRTRHIELALWADLMVIAPASANTIAKLTGGLSDNLLTIIALACRAPIVLVPTMDADMYLNPITQKNLVALQERGYYVIAPEEGELASGLVGPGRLPEVETVLQYIGKVLDGSDRDLVSRKILVTAGPTYEAIDPVRFIGNRSSGKMGFAIACAAAMRGAEVTLISGPVHLETPRHVRRINVESAHEMYENVMTEAKETEAIIMAAAVADYTPAKTSPKKIKKTVSGEIPQVELRTTVDILHTLGKKKDGKKLIGFALETDDEFQHALDKLKAKNLDLIILNSLQDEGAGFGVETNVVTIIDAAGHAEKLPKLSKFDVAHRILDRVKHLFSS